MQNFVKLYITGFFLFFVNIYLYKDHVHTSTYTKTSVHITKYVNWEYALMKLSKKFKFVDASKKVEIPGLLWGRKWRSSFALLDICHGEKNRIIYSVQTRVFRLNYTHKFIEPIYDTILVISSNK